jgi:histidine ammonia-lyase
VLVLDGNSLRIEDVARAAFRVERSFSISESAKEQVRLSRKLVEQWVEKGETIYGVTTGFGEFANVSIPHDDLKLLQLNLVRSHSAGVGQPLADEVVRAMLLLRANALAKGCSGIRLEVIEFLLRLLALDILPVIPSRGSVGSSGDLAPLSHLALALIGEGRVTVAEGSGRIEMNALEAFRIAGLSPILLEAKEGLALINGTQMMTALGSLALKRAEELAELSDISAALSFEALRATDTAFDPRLHAARPHSGQATVARHMLALTKDSEIRRSHEHNDPRVQDAYSLRCIPQVHGAVRDNLAHIRRVLEIEVNSATDNPLVVAESVDADGVVHGAHLEGGNFHGEPVAFVLDLLAIVVSELASISERRTERLVNGALSQGLPRFLTPKGGLNSGYMIAQYTAAALVSENKVLAHPASVDSIPTSANQEDHNSMGSVAALKLPQVIGNVERVLAIEMLCAAQGVDFLAPLKPGVGSGTAHRLIREAVPTLDHDRTTSIDIDAVLKLIQSPGFLDSVSSSTK